MKRKILITSINAGGGHKTAMYSLGYTLDQYVEGLEYEYFISGIEDFDKMHFILNIYFPLFYAIGYALSEKSLFRLLKNIFIYRQNLKFQRELEVLLENNNPEVIISTHFTQTERLVVLKKKKKISSKIITYVPDYDLTTVHFPYYYGMTPNALIAQNSGLLDKVNSKYGIKKEYLQEAGYVTRPEFTEARKLTRDEAISELSKTFYPSTNRLEAGRFTIVVTGGAAWVSKVYKEVEMLVNKSEVDWNKAQILIVCGSNKAAYSKFSYLARKNPDKIIVAFPFLPYEHMSLVFRSSNLTILASIAPASLYELVEVKSGPIVVHRTNPGQEKENLNYAVRSGLAKYIPDDKDLIRFVERVVNSNSLPSKFELEYQKALVKERMLARNNARDTALFIDKILNEHVS